VQSWEPRFKEAAKRAFKIDLRNVLAIMNEHKSLALSQKQTIDWNQIFVNWQKYFEEEAPENWREQFQPLLIGLMTDTAELRNAQFGISFDVTNLFVPDVIQQEQQFSAWFEQYADIFSAEILQTTQDDLRKLLIQANDEGFTIDEMRRQIQANFERYVTLGFEPRLTEQEMEWFTERLPKYRAEMIARTESMRASGEATNELYKAWGIVEQKEWLSAQDDRVRPAHVQADGQIVDFEEPFIVMNERLMFPRDTSLGASPENVIQCRCQSLAVIQEREIQQEETSVSQGINLPELTTEQNQILNRAQERFRSMYSGSASNLPFKAETDFNAVARLRGNRISINPEFFNQEALNDRTNDNIRRSQRRVTRLQQELVDKEGVLSGEQVTDINDTIQRLNTRIQELETRPPWAAPENLQEIILHEYGHAIRQDLQSGEFENIPDFLPPSELNKLGINFEDSLNFILEEFAQVSGDQISEYAMTDGDEYFAEAFVRYTQGRSNEIFGLLADVFDEVLE
jgi:SPP1 gp7 family putative phage head morphogenesis protein